MGCAANQPPSCAFPVHCCTLLLLLQLGFFLLLAIEGIAGKGILELAGITTGNGLGFEF